MKGLPISPASVALVFWNKSTKEVFLDVKNLPVPPEGMQYQLWALDNGVPVDAGVFDLADAGNLQKLKSINNAQAFAVTLEYYQSAHKLNVLHLRIYDTYGPKDERRKIIPKRRGHLRPSVRTG
jgi:hypothetical protein